MAVFKVKATSTLPLAKAVWEVDLGADPEAALIYTNLGYDLIAKDMAKLGVAFSEYIIDGDSKKLDALAEEVSSGRVE